MGPGIKMSSSGRKGGPALDVDVDSSMTIKTLKEILARDTGTPIDELRIIYLGEPLEDDEQTLGEVGVTKGAELHLVVG